MDLQTPHALLSRPTTDELGRESFLAAMREFLITELYSGNEIAYKKRQVPAFVAGYAFGLWSGVAMALLSQLIACTVDFVWARAVARDFVTRRFGKRLQKIDAALAARPFMTTLTFRLMPVGNNLLLNLVAGMSSVRAVPFLAASLVGFIPQTVVFALLGRGSVPSQADKLAVGAGMFLVSAALGVVLLLKYRREAA